MSYQYMLFEVKENVALVTFNRPEALNSLSPEVLIEFGDILDKIRADEEISVAVLVGAGDKAFVAGADIKVMMTHTPLDARKFSALGHEVFFKIEALLSPGIPTILKH